MFFRKGFPITQFALSLAVLITLTLVGCGRTESPALPQTQRGAPGESDSLKDLRKSIVRLGNEVAPVVKKLETNFYQDKSFSQELISLNQIDQAIANHKKSMTADEASKLKEELKHTSTQIRLGLIRGFGRKTVVGLREVGKQVRRMRDQLRSLPRSALDDLLPPPTITQGKAIYIEALKKAHTLMDEIKWDVADKKLAGKLYVIPSIVVVDQTPFDLGGPRDMNLNILINKANAESSLAVLSNVKNAIENLLFDLAGIRKSENFVGEKDQEEVKKTLDALQSKILSLVDTLKIKKSIEEISTLEDVLPRDILIE